MTGKLRAGLIGCGFFARNHLHAWRELADEVELVAVCDRDAERVGAARKAFDVPAAYTDAAAMLARERLDFVDIVTTMPAHRALVTLAAAHKVAVIVQKPFAPTWDDCVAMVEACRDAGVPLMVHENFRFQAPMLAVAEVLRSGVLGPLTWARLSWRTGYDVYAGQPYLAQEKQLVILDVGIHVLDLARVFLGEVTRLACETQSIRPGIAGEDMATMLLRHEAGAVSVVEVTYAARRQPDTFPETLLEIEGRDGALALDHGLRLRVTAGGGTTERHVGTPLRPWTSEPWHVAQESVLNTQRHWLECLRAGREPATSGRDNLKTYALVMAAYEAAAHGRAVAPRHWSG